MSAFTRLQWRINAAYKAFMNPLAIKSYGGYGAYGYHNSDLSTGSTALWTKWGAATAVLVNHAVFACVTKRAETISGLPFRVVDKETRRPVDPKQDPLMQLFDRYSKYYGGTNLFQEWMYDRDLTGEVFIEPLRDQYSGRIVAIDLLPSLNVTPWSTDGVHISHFQYQAGMYFHELPPDALIYDRNTIARMTTINGYSPTLVAIGSNAIGVVQGAGKAVLAYFNNDGIPATMVMPTSEAMLSKDIINDLGRIFRPIKNASGKYATAISPVKLDVLQTQQPDLLKWSELLRAVEPQIYTAFRTPRSVAGDSDSTSYQASPNDLVNFDAVMSATASDLAAVINTALAPLVYDTPEPSVEFEFETAQLDHIPQEERQAARDAWETGAITLNEYREWIGLEPIDGGDVYQKRIGAEYVTADGFIPRPEPAPAAAPLITSAVETEASPPPGAPPQLPEYVPARTAADELDQYKMRVINGRAFKSEFVWSVIDPETARCIESDIYAAGDIRTQKSVLNRWRKALRAREGITNYHKLAPADLPEATRAYIKSLDDLGYSEDVIATAAESHYAGVIGMKALSSVRGRFEAECMRLMTRAVSERIGKARFIADMETMLFRYAYAAFIEGFADAGVGGYEPEGDDERYLLAFNDEQRTHIRNVADKLYADDELTEDEIRGKPQMWWNLSVHPAYNEGMVRASKDGIGVFYIGPTEDKCADCPRLHLQARRFSTWLKYFDGQLVPCDKTECGGFRCECVITPRQTALSSGRLPRLVGSRKAVTSGIELEVIRA